MDSPITGRSRETVRFTVKDARTTTVFVAFATCPIVSATVSLTLKLPCASYVWRTDNPLSLDRSPKVHSYVYGDVPPVAVALKVTSSPTTGSGGVNVKFAVTRGV